MNKIRHTLFFWGELSLELNDMFPSTFVSRSKRINMAKVLKRLYTGLLNTC